MKKKLIIGICSFAVIALLSSSYVIYNNTVKNKDANNSEKFEDINANFSEIRLSEDELIEQSDVIVRCKFKGEKKSKESTRETEGETGVKYNIVLPVTTYKMKLIESLKGSVDKTFTVVTLGGGNEYLESGDEYVLFLHDNKPEDTYTLISYSQGLNIVNYVKDTKLKSNDASDSNASEASADDGIEIKSAETHEVMKYKDLKDKITKLKK